MYLKTFMVKSILPIDHKKCTIYIFTNPFKFWKPYEFGTNNIFFF